MKNLANLNQRQWTVQLAVCAGLALLFIAPLMWGLQGVARARAEPGTLRAVGDDLQGANLSLTYSGSQGTWVETRKLDAARLGVGSPSVDASASFSARERAAFSLFLPAVQRSYQALWHDDFDEPGLDPSWWWVGENPAHWSLTARPGFLRLISHPGGVAEENLLLRDAPAGDFTLTTRVLFRPTHNFQMAGLVLYGEPGTLLKFGRAYCSAPAPTCVGNGIYFDHLEGGNPVGANFATSTSSQDEAYLRVSRQGTTYSGYYSENGTTWTLVGSHTVGVGVDLPSVGLAVANDVQDIQIPGDFDFFEVRAGS
jgi:hypothetical protein